MLSKLYSLSIISLRKLGDVAYKFYERNLTSTKQLSLLDVKLNMFFIRALTQKLTI